MKFQILVLKNTNKYVDEARLSNGLYHTDRPTLHNMKYTLEDMLAIYKEFWSQTPRAFENMKMNLDKCELVTVKLIRE
jgi:hypothetical protein